MLLRHRKPPDLPDSNDYHHQFKRTTICSRVLIRFFQQLSNVVPTFDAWIKLPSINAGPTEHSKRKLYRMFGNFSHLHMKYSVGFLRHAWWEACPSHCMRPVLNRITGPGTQHLSYLRHAQLSDLPDSSYYASTDTLLVPAFDACMKLHFVPWVSSY